MDLRVAQREHDAFVRRCRPRARVHELDVSSPARTSSTRSTRSWSPTAEPSRSDPASRTGAAEPAALEAWTRGAGIPTLGRIEAPVRSRAATRSGSGPTCSASGGRSGRILTAGAARGAGRRRRAHLRRPLLGDRPNHPPAVVISPVADDLAVVYLPLLPVGLWELLGELGIRLLGPGRGVPDARLQRPGGTARCRHPCRGQPVDGALLAAAGCEVRTYPATEIGLNGSGGPTCMTRPILRG